VAVTAPHDLVGRSAELQSIESFLDRAAVAPAALLLEGEAGIGKTSLWRELLARAEARGVLVLAARGAEAETRLSFAALGDLVGADVDRTSASLPKPQRRALEVALGVAEPAFGPPEPRLVALAALGVLRALAGERPLLLALDDCQWLDPPSAEALHFAVRRLEDGAVGIAATLRSGHADPLELERAFLPSSPRSSRCRGRTTRCRSRPGGKGRELRHLFVHLFP
jgi:hypothetical protein